MQPSFPDHSESASLVSPKLLLYTISHIVSAFAHTHTHTQSGLRIIFTVNNLFFRLNIRIATFTIDRPPIRLSSLWHVQTTHRSLIRFRFYRTVETIADLVLRVSVTGFVLDSPVRHAAYYIMYSYITSRGEETANR